MESEYKSSLLTLTNLEKEFVASPLSELVLAPFNFIFTKTKFLHYLTNTKEKMEVDLLTTKLSAKILTKYFRTE